MDQERDAAATRSNPAVRIAEDDRGSYDGNKPPHEIEEDIARTRVRMSATVEALERELAPRRVIENGAEVLRNALEPRPGPFRDQLWAYAIPLALIVTGLGWFFVLRGRSRQADLPRDFSETTDDAVEAAEMPSPGPLYTGVVDPVEPVSLVNETHRSDSYQTAW